MEQKEADKIREIIRTENISKLSISDLNKYINLINEIFPDSANSHFGTSEIASIRQRLTTTLQIRLFKIARCFTVIALTISIIALAVTIWGKVDDKATPVYLVQPPQEIQEKNHNESILQKLEKKLIILKEEKLSTSLPTQIDQDSDEPESTVPDEHAQTIPQQKNKDAKKDVFP